MCVLTDKSSYRRNGVR